ncbi:MAG: helix-turn-helix transcriptional regulator [Actinophytocola sp.]|uniref:helix-turn-helix transcriptional regulator n=1 Tax=Actinophytocola sp. TaxID=1872138 RepID=UPI003C7623E4
MIVHGALGVGKTAFLLELMRSVSTSAGAGSVWAIDDFQWADGQTINELARMMHGRPAHVAQLVVTVSPGRWPDLPVELARLFDGAMRITLGGLTGDHIERLLKESLPGAVPDELVGAVHHASQGNPALLMPLMNHPATARLEALAQGHLSPADAEAMCVPFLDRLGEYGTELLDVCTEVAIARSAHPGGLLTGSDWPPGRLNDTVLRLCGLGLLEPGTTLRVAYPLIETALRHRARLGGLPAVGIPTSELTAHEHRVAVLASAGHTNRQIAREFNVSPRAIEFHLTSLYVKLGINRRAQLSAALAKEFGRYQCSGSRGYGSP